VQAQERIQEAKLLGELTIIDDKVVAFKPIVDNSPGYLEDAIQEGIEKYKKGEKSAKSET
jgi:hypothetical protein